MDTVSNVNIRTFVTILLWNISNSWIKIFAYDIFTGHSQFFLFVDGA